MQVNQIREKLKEIARQYPPELVAAQMDDISRIAFNITISIPIGKSVDEASICDIGGGIGLFSLGCAAIGFRKVFLVDDFADQINKQLGTAIFDIHHRYGVEIISRDVVAAGLGNLGEPLDVITCFDSMEHWHRSPKKLFHELIGSLKPAGRFVLGVPNCVNLRKRLTVPLGYGKWSAMQDWYEPENFRGHVREPDVQDLWHIAHDLALSNVRILGRNWLGLQSSRKPMRVMTNLLDPLMRFRPSLCSNIYLVGQKTHA